PTNVGGAVVVVAGEELVVVPVSGRYPVPIPPEGVGAVGPVHLADHVRGLVGLQEDGPDFLLRLTLTADSRPVPSHRLCGRTNVRLQNSERGPVHVSPLGLYVKLELKSVALDGEPAVLDDDQVMADVGAVHVQDHEPLLPVR